MSARVSELAADRAARRELRDALDELHAAQVHAGERSPVRRSIWLLTGLLVIAAIALAAVAVTGWVHASDRYTDADYERAASQRLAVLLSPDHRDPAQVRRILAGATGTFYDEFAQSADAYTTFVRANGTVTESSIDGTGVAGRSGEAASVLVAATVTFDSGPKPAHSSDVVRRFRLRVLVEPDDGVLKLGAVQYLP